MAASRTAACKPSDTLTASRRRSACSLSAASNSPRSGTVVLPFLPLIPPRNIAPLAIGALSFAGRRNLTASSVRPTLCVPRSWRCRSTGESDLPRFVTPQDASCPFRNTNAPQWSWPPHHACSAPSRQRIHHPPATSSRDANLMTNSPPAPTNSSSTDGRISRRASTFDEWLSLAATGRFSLIISR